MVPTETAPTVLSVANVGAQTARQLHNLTDHWTSAPRDVHRLRATVAQLCRLLESAAATHAGLDGDVAVKGSRGLDQDLVTAKDILIRLEETLVYVRGSARDSDGSEEVVSYGSTKTRWLARRDETTELRVELHDVYQRILAQLAVLNVSVSTDVAVPPPQQQSVLTSDEAVAEQINPHYVDDARSPRMSFQEQKARMPLRGADPIVRGKEEQVNQDIDARLKVRFQEQKTIMHWRDGRNEQSFRHLEQVFSAITTTTSPNLSPHPNDFNETRLVPRSRPLPPAPAPGFARMPREFCTQGCRCQCHGSRTYTIWTLSAFKSTIGAFTFQFSGRLRLLGGPPEYDPLCGAQHTRTRGLTYTFPTWLLHSAISATFSDRGGSPELLLRVLRRIAPDNITMNASIFRTVWRREAEDTKRMLQRREGSIYDIRGDDGRSVLMTALQTRNFEISVLLLQAGADLFQVADDGIAPFHEVVHLMYGTTNVPASSRDMLESASPMDLIIERANLTDLHKVAMGIFPISIREYLSSGRVHSLDDINVGDTMGKTPLYYACARNHMEAAQALLESGASPHIPSSPVRLTPLHIACRAGNLEIVRMLLDAGASVHAATVSKVTPLHAVCEMGANWIDQTKGSEPTDRVKIAMHLLSHGADIGAEDRDKSTPLDLASIHNHGALADYLVESGADPSHRDWEGSNSLGNATGFNSASVAAVLLRRGVDYKNVDDNGLGILHYAAMNANLEVLDVLAAHGLAGLDVEAEDKQGSTAMQIFCGRANMSDELRLAFQHLWDTVAKAQCRLEGSDDEFFDALES